MDSKMRIPSQFGPKIVIIKLPKKIVTKLTDITDELIVSKKRKNFGCALAGIIEEEV